MNLLHEWWAWGAGALVLAVIEVLAPSYVFLGFALGAGFVANLLLLDGWLGIGPYAATSLALIFAVASLFAWIALRFVFGAPGSNVKIWRKDINDN